MPCAHLGASEARGGFARGLSSARLGERTGGLRRTGKIYCKFYLRNEMRYEFRVAMGF
ncbi:hypothetical protein SAMN05444166_2809 [Singulisphaera sp. GP187]|nr:hypothetical protein SAMN05444166_2809 [Singulisphaera sp. GP187]